MRKLLLWFLIASPGFGNATRAADSACDDPIRKAAVEAVRQDGYSDLVTPRRDDTKAFPLFSSQAMSLVYLDIRVGGVVVDESGRAHTQFMDHPWSWAVYVDPENLKVYRLFGFKTGNDFSELARRLNLKIDATSSEALAEGFLEMSYSERCSVVHNLFEARRFIEDELYNAFDPPEFRSYVKKVGKRLRDVAFGSQSEPLDPGREGYQYAITVARVATQIGSRPSVEVRRISVLVGKDAGVSIVSDKLLDLAELTDNED